jgi:hypothetical protein
MESQGYDSESGFSTNVIATASVSSQCVIARNLKSKITREDENCSFTALLFVHAASQWHK